MTSQNIIPNFTTEKHRFLSNFYPHKKDGSKYPHNVKVIYNDIEFDCVENAYQAAKFINKEMQMKFSQLTPYEAVEFWKDNHKYRKNWHEVKLNIMENLVWQKFNNNTELAKMLIETNDMILEEGNDWGDVFWGICDGIGENHLGKILMNVRIRLMQKKEV